MTNYYYLLSLEYAYRPTRSFELYSTGVGICIRVHIYMYRVTNHTVYVTLRVQRTHEKKLILKKKIFVYKNPPSFSLVETFFSMRKLKSTTIGKAKHADNTTVQTKV